MTNARKAAIIAAINAVLSLLLAFGVALSDVQVAAIGVTANALLGLWIAFTYKDSPARIPDDGFVFEPDWDE